MRKYPFLRLSLLFAVGILLANYISLTPSTLKIFIIVLIPLLGFLFFLARRTSTNLYLFGFAFSVFIMGFGFSVYHINNDIFVNNKFEKTNFPYYKVKINSFPLEKDGTFRCDVRILSGKKPNGTILPLRGNAIIKIARNIVTKPKIGSIYIVKNKFTNPIGQLMPGTFNYAEYLRRKKIYRTAYLGYADIEFVESSPQIWEKLATQLREYVVHIINSRFDNADHLGLLQGLLLGDKSELSKETYDAFAKSGTMHVLAVSGLHVGIIFILLLFIIKRINGQNQSKILSIMFVLIGLWTYALITGFSASVSRAALMFTIMYIGKVYSKSGHVVNNLFAASFLLLVYNPNFLFQVGFQLSISAVLSIVLFSNKIESFIHPKSLLLRKAWMICAVSISAQMGTAIIAIYYFHHFPLFFLLANLIIVPAVMGLVIGAIALLIVSFIPYFSGLLTLLVKILLSIIIYTANNIEQLPHSIIPNIQVNFIHVISTFLLLVALYLFLSFNRNTIKYLGLSIVLFAFGNLYQSNISKPRLIYGMFKKTQYFVIHNSDTLHSIIISPKKNDWIAESIKKYAKLNKISIVNSDFITNKNSNSRRNVILKQYWNKKVKFFCNLSNAECLNIFNVNEEINFPLLNPINKGIKKKPKSYLLYKRHWIYLK